MCEKFYQYIQKKGSPVSALELVENILRIDNATPAIATKLVETTVKDSKDIVQTQTGLWDIKPKNEQLKLSDFALCLLRPERVYHWEQWQGLVLARFLDDGQIDQQIIFDAFESGDTFLPSRVNRKILEFVGDRLVVLEGFGNQYSQFQCVLNPDRVLSFTKILRQLYPATRLNSSEQISKLFGCQLFVDSDVDYQMKTFTEQFRCFFECLKIMNIKTQSELFDIYEYDKPQIDFTKYAFDREFLNRLPTGPGIYKMYDKRHDLIYVGKAKNLMQRINSYFQKIPFPDQKLLAIRSHLYDIEYHETGNELEALLSEFEAIDRYAPAFNKQINVFYRSHIEKYRHEQVLFLPTQTQNNVMLYLVHPVNGIHVIETDKSHFEHEKIKKAVSGMFFKVHKVPEKEKKKLEIMLSWLADNFDHVNQLDMRLVGSLEDAMRIISDYVTHFEENKRNIQW